MSNSTPLPKGKLTGGQKVALVAGGVAGGTYTAAQAWNLVANHACSKWIKKLDAKIGALELMGKFAMFNDIPELTKMSTIRPPPFGVYVNCTMPLLFLFDFSCPTRHILGGVNNTPVICRPKFTIEETDKLERIIRKVNEYNSTVSIVSTNDAYRSKRRKAAYLSTRCKTVTTTSLTAMTDFFKNRDAYDRYGIEEQSIFDHVVGRRILASLCVETAPLERVSVILGYAHIPDINIGKTCANIFVIVSTRTDERQQLQRLYPPLVGFSIYRDAMIGITAFTNMKFGTDGKTRFVDMKTFNCANEPEKDEARTVLRRLLLCSGEPEAPLLNRSRAVKNKFDTQLHLRRAELKTTVPQGFVQRVVGEGLWQLSPRVGYFSETVGGFNSEIRDLDASVESSIDRTDKLWGLPHVIREEPFTEYGADQLLLDCQPNKSDALNLHHL